MKFTAENRNNEKNNMMLELVFSSDANTEPRFPQIKITAENDDESLYLSPFRGYKFQISGTDDGQWDIESTEVVGLGNIMNLVLKDRDYSHTSLTSSNIGRTSDKFHRHYMMTMIENLLLRLSIRCDLDYSHLNKNSNGEYNQDVINKFIDAVIDYVNAFKR